MQPRSSARRITTGTLGGDTDREDFEPSHSPSGRRLVFARYNGPAAGTGDFESFTANPDGSKPIRLTRNGVDDRNPDWAR